MRGLLDVLNSEEGQLGLSLLAAAGPSAVPMSFGQRLAGAMGQFNQQKQAAADRKMMEEYRRMQMDAMQAQNEERRAAAVEKANLRQWEGKLPEFIRPQVTQGSVSTPEMGGMPMFSQGTSVATPSMQGPTRFDVASAIQQRMPLDVLNKGVQIDQLLNPKEEAYTLSEGQTRFVAGKPVNSVPKAQDLPAAVREYQFAVQQGYPGTFQQFQLEQKKAGASSTNVNVNTEKSFLNALAGDLGKGVSDARGQASAAASTVRTASGLMEVLDSGKVLAGPATPVARYMLQLGDVFGVTGKDAQDRLTKTRSAMQSLAQLELDAAQQMKGQGQITESERAILRKAASGDVDTMTTSELRVLASSLDKIGRAKIQTFQQQVQPLLSNPNAAPLAPFLNIDMPPAYQPPSVVRRPGQNNGPRFLGFE